jgi:amino acid transporter
MTDRIDRDPEERPPPGAPGHITSIEDPEETRLNRVITRPMLTFFILGDILGAGIYSLTGIVGASIIYLLVGFTAAMTVPLDTLTESSGPLLEVVKEGVPGLNADTVFSAVAMTAVSNTMLINMLMASRLLYGMANQGVLPAPFGLVSARKTPWFGIAFTTALSILLILTTDDLEGLSDTTVLLLTSVFLLPIDRTAEIYRTAVFLLLGGLALWAVNFLVTRRTGTVVAEQDLTTGPEDDDRP